MVQRTILLNGGRDQDVEPLEGADSFLARLLGAAPTKPAVPALRSVQSPEGQHCVGVFIGNQQVGYLCQPVDNELLATIQACELNGAVARARGNLMASWDRPGKVKLKVSLADPEHLLCDPESEDESLPNGADAAAEAAAEAEPAGAASDAKPAGQSPSAPQLVASLEDAPARRSAGGTSPLAASLEDAPGAEHPPAGLEDATAPALSAHWNGDYPDWPPRKTKPSDLAQTAAPAQPVAFAQTGAPAQRVADPGLVRPEKAGGGLEVAPPPEHALTDPQPSAEAIMTGRSPWSAITPPQTFAPQAGWLGSTVRTIQELPTSAPGAESSSAELAAAPGTGFLGAGAQTAAVGTPQAGADSTPPEPVRSWQDFAERVESRGAFDDKPHADPTPPDPSPQPAPRPTPVGLQKRTNTWIFSALAVLVVVAAGFLLWKTEFAPKTHVSTSYGYSYSYPARWTLANEDSMLASLSSMASTVKPLEVSMAGHGITQATPSEFGFVGVAMYEIGVIGDPAQLQPELQTELDRAVAATPGMTIVDPLSTTTVGGLSGYKLTVTMTSDNVPMTVAYCFAFDNTHLYELVAACNPSAWEGNRANFDKFFKSFHPATKT